jgi:putative component of membrane protein insertase Oxa1/YidC/SpoIIIJ protein YidD
MRPGSVVAVFLFALLAWVPIRAQDKGAAGTASDASATEPVSRAFAQAALASSSRGPGAVKAFFSLLLGFYSAGVSPADGPTCSFYPTCSGYAHDALRRHGLAAGILMTGDRLMRCNGYDKSPYPLIGPDSHYYDPVP